jgi:hypothetical protein
VRLGRARIDDLPLGEPRDQFERGDGEAAAEHHDGVSNLWKGEVARSVLHDEHGPSGKRELGQLIGPELELGQLPGKTRHRREEAEPDVPRPRSEAVPAGEVARGWVDAADRQHVVKQAAQDLAVPLDELGVDPRHVQVAEVERAMVVVDDPACGGQQPVPDVEVGERLQWVIGDPSEGTRQR